MRKFILLLALLPVCVFAQNFQKNGEKYEVYCDVKHFTNAFGKTTITITVNDDEFEVVDENGNQVKTKEVTMVLNLLAKRGWKLVSSFGTSGGSKVLPIEKHYTMKKEISNDDEINIGISKK